MEPMVFSRDDARRLDVLIAAGRRAAALDGQHFTSWGLIASALLALQYAAEVGDWLPSQLLWLWQPLALVGFVLAIFIPSRGAGRRLGHPVARAYTFAFASAGAALAAFMIVAGAGALPDGHITILLVTAVLGGAFVATACVTPLRWMAVPGLGWLAMSAFYAGQQAVVPADWLRLSLAFALLLALPGAVLIKRAPR
jgi:hypothetical protein